MKFKLSPEDKAKALAAVNQRIMRIAKQLATTRILIWTEKGGDGKTALTCALAFEFDFSVITNEHRSPLAQIFPEGDVLVLEKDEPFPFVPEGNRVIFDCKGAADDVVIGAAENADIIIVPVKDHSDAQLLMFLESMAAMIPHNPNIIMVANAVPRGKFSKTRQRIAEHYPDLPLIEIKESSAFNWVSNEGMSISQLMKEKPASCSAFASIRDQILDLAQVIAFEATQKKAKAA